MIKFIDGNGNIQTGILRRKNKIDEYYLITSLSGKTYFVLPNEIVEGDVPDEIYTGGEAVKIKKKRGRPRKTR